MVREISLKVREKSGNFVFTFLWELCGCGVGLPGYQVINVALYVIYLHKSIGSIVLYMYCYSVICLLFMCYAHVLLCICVCFIISWLIYIILMHAINDFSTNLYIWRLHDVWSSVIYMTPPRQEPEENILCMYTQHLIKILTKLSPWKLYYANFDFITFKLWSLLG